ncbi:MAG: YkvA family protein [Methanobacterium sp.]
MEINFKDYLDVLKENLDSYDGKYEKIIDYSPELFKLLTDILNEKIISSESRLKISAALGYFVAPFDIIPEEIYGPDGYVDDLYIVAYVLMDITSEYGYDFLDDLWDNDEKLIEVIEECYTKSKEILGDKTSFVLSYIGLN